MKNILLFQKIQKLDKQAILRVLQPLFIRKGFMVFCISYHLIFPEMEKGNLVNPLQVITQLGCFLFLFNYRNKPVRIKKLVVLSFFLSLLCSLFLVIGIDWKILSFFLFLFCIFINLNCIPVEYPFFIIFFGYFLDKGLAEWGFFLAFQQLSYYLINVFLEKEEKDIFILFCFILILMIQLIYGYFHYGDFSLIDPLKLTALFSGACIIYLSSPRSTKIFFPFAFSFFLSILIGFLIGPAENEKIWGIPVGILIFCFFHFFFLLGLFVFKPRRTKPFLPFFFSGLFHLLGYFPELALLSEWIEGIDLLLLLIGIISLMENEEGDLVKRTGCSRRKSSARTKS